MIARTVSPVALAELVQRVFVALGFREASAATIAQSLVTADLRGVHSHGVLLVPMYVERIQRALVGRHETGEVVVDRQAVAVIDGGNGMGQLIGRQAMELAVTKAAAYGIGAVGVRHSHHFGAAFSYVELAAKRGCIGIAASNTTPLMPPPGGAEVIVGNNPLAVAVPMLGEEPMVLDMALSEVAGGKIRHAFMAGQQIPLGWATDANGKPTADPAAALQGFLLPMGGPKGFGLALLVDVLAGVLAGGAWGRKVRSLYKDMENPNDCGHFFLAVHIEHFLPAADFAATVTEMARQVRTASRAPHVERIYVPGEIEREKATDYQRHGIPLTGEVLTKLVGTAHVLGLAVDESRLEFPSAQSL